MRKHMAFSRNDGLVVGGFWGVVINLVVYFGFFEKSIPLDTTEGTDFLVGGSILLFLIFAVIGIFLGDRWIPWDEWHKNTDEEFKEVFRKKISCRSCKSDIEGRTALERTARGVGGAGVGSATGAVLGTIFLPGVGTVIGGGIGAWAGSTEGSQVSDICIDCCQFCINKKTNCSCFDIVAYCISCGDSISRRDHVGLNCFSCRDSSNGDDL